MIVIVDSRGNLSAQNEFSSHFWPRNTFFEPIAEFRILSHFSRVQVGVPVTLENLEKIEIFWNFQIYPQSGVSGLILAPELILSTQMTVRGFYRSDMPWFKIVILGYIGFSLYFVNIIKNKVI